MSCAVYTAKIVSHSCSVGGVLPPLKHASRTAPPARKSVQACFSVMAALPVLEPPLLDPPELEPLPPLELPVLV
jgi:hypothetical protein